MAHVRVEFADRYGRAYAIFSIEPEKLMILHDAPDPAAKLSRIL
jgi:hypothetical protein